MRKHKSFRTIDETNLMKKGDEQLGVVEEEAFEAFAGTESLPFPAGEHGRAAVKVIDPRGNEVMQVHELGAGG